MPNKGTTTGTSASAQRDLQKRRREDSADEMSLDDEDLEDDEGEEDDGEPIVNTNPNTKMRIITSEHDGYVSVPNLCSSKYAIKIGLTLYKVQHSIYLLDFQKMNGDAFTFMSLCAAIITELKTLSAANKLQQQQQQAALLAMQQQQQQQLSESAPKG